MMGFNEVAQAGVILWGETEVILGLSCGDCMHE